MVGLRHCRLASRGIKKPTTVCTTRNHGLLSLNGVAVMGRRCGKGNEGGRGRGRERDSGRARESERRRARETVKEGERGREEGERERERKESERGSERTKSGLQGTAQTLPLLEKMTAGQCNWPRNHSRTPYAIRARGWRRGTARALTAATTGQEGTRRGQRRLPLSGPQDNAMRGLPSGQMWQTTQGCDPASGRRAN